MEKILFLLLSIAEVRSEIGGMSDWRHTEVILKAVSVEKSRETEFVGGQW